MRANLPAASRKCWLHELGLMVAIPTLVAHGFLSHRIQKNLSLLERYALNYDGCAARQAARAAKETVSV